MNAMPESILLKPADRPFDLPAIERILLEHPAICREPNRAEAFLVARDEAARENARQRRLEDPRNSISVGVIRLQQTHLVFAIAFSLPEDLAIMRDLAEQIVAEYQPRILSEIVDDDWTDRCADGLDPMFPDYLPPRAGR